MGKYQGIGASAGVAVGKVLLLVEEKLEIVKRSINDVEAEQNRFDNAVTVATGQLQTIVETTREKMGEDKAAIFEAHLMILSDPEMGNQVKDLIANENVNAEYALNEVRNIFIGMFEAMDDEYMRERAVDIKDVTERILKILMDIPIFNLASLEEEVIIVANDLTPSDTATMDSKKVLGIATNMGGRTSHTAIMARTLELPAVVGLKDITTKVQNGDIIAFDGKEGIIQVNPSDVIIAQYEERKAAYHKEKIELQALLHKESVTKDGHHVELAANIGTPKDVKGVVENGGDAVGLYRTEFLYMDSDTLPTEEEQFQAYKAVVEGMQGKPVIIRTLDIGGDKELKSMELPKEMNPFLGYRAIRICLDDKELFKTQLRALLRASNYGILRIMFPMISSVQEVRQAKAILKEAKAELIERGETFDDSLQVGIMVEIPTAAVISDLLAKEVDFFSIGTNDLIQYSTAVDRMNEQIAHLYNPLHPGVLRLIKMVIENAHAQGKFVGMCGEMAGDPKYIPVLLGLGLDEFSMSAVSILPARKLIRNLSFAKAKEIAAEVVNMATAEEISEYLDRVLA